MEDKNTPPLANAETESRVVTTATDVAVTAGGTHGNAAINGNGDAGGGEAAVGGVNGESEGVEAQVKVRRKRGRPRKHQVDNHVSVTTLPDFSPSPAIFAQKRGRGRPRGSGKLQILASLGGFSVDTVGGNFTPHAVTIQTGEDIVDTILSFAKRGPQSICILSASGAVSCVDICQPGFFGGILRYEGRFEILTLTGSHAFSEVGVVRQKNGMLSVSLANPDGQVFGGAVAGSLIAAGPIQLIVASFKQNIKKPLQMRHSAESSKAAGIPGRGTLAVPAPIGKTRDVEENCVTPTSPLPETLNKEPPNISRDQNMNHASLGSVDQDGLQSSEPMLDQNTSDINGCCS
ncbi:hypothetical protein F0562_022176 [Nyssa sinensis]|uniref:AT-hook motif nuclear-localized protein n=1 Tax=Nyssa sinensis TaxID=561372 RepID=A0A5J5BN59_9ASTE|nr:hypothetical protein F0562_022176 [Nyssa sinensis]